MKKVTESALIEKIIIYLKSVGKNPTADVLFQLAFCDIAALKDICKSCGIKN